MAKTRYLRDVLAGFTAPEDQTYVWEYRFKTPSRHLTQWKPFEAHTFADAEQAAEDYATERGWKIVGRR